MNRPSTESEDETPPTIKVGAVQDDGSVSAITSGASTTGASSAPSDYMGTWQCLTHKRKIFPVDAAYDGRFKDPGECWKIVNKFFSLLRNSGQDDDSNHDDVRIRGLVGLLNSDHENELHFNNFFFEKLGDTVQDVLRRMTTEREVEGRLTWSVERVLDEGVVDERKATKMIVLKPRPRILISDGAEEVEVAMGLVREAHLAPDKTTTHRTSSKPDHAWAIFERPVPTPSGAAAAVIHHAEDEDGDREASNEDEENGCGKMKRSEKFRDDGGGKMTSRPAAMTATATSSSTGGISPSEVSGAMGNKDKIGWTVRCILAVVDLKTQGTACAPFKTKECGMHVDGESIDTEGRKHGALAQATMYTLAHVLWGRAALGPSELPETIPTAIVVCKIKDKVLQGATSSASISVTAGGKDHWALAHLTVPKECGGGFSIGVTAFGKLSDSQSAVSLLAVYLHVMASGLEAASEWLRKVKESGEPPRPALMSGRTLMFGNETRLDEFTVPAAQKELSPSLELLATPVSRYGSNCFKIAQGELLQATLHLERLRAATTGGRLVFWCKDNFDKEEAVQQVLIKITSFPCFNVLVRSNFLVNIGSEGSTTETIAEILSQSLHGLYVTKSRTGLVQILVDLRSQGYRRLRPEDVVRKAGWKVLWTAFENFIVNVLLPLGRANIVHTDIRAGFDETANLLYNSEKGSIVMVDLDSLCSLDTWESVTLRRSELRYLKLTRLRMRQLEAFTSLDFVCLQATCIAEVWLAREENDKVNADDAVFRGRIDLLSSSSDLAINDKVKAVLDHYRGRFAEMDDRPPKKQKHVE
jgi:hypothetical protein